MKFRTYQLSFAGGEISEPMAGRPDSRQYATGAALMRNMICRPQGAVTRRPGFQFVNTSFDTNIVTNLLPFVYSVDQALAVELGNEAIRFHTAGQTLRWARNIDLGASGYDTATDEITAIDDHGLVDDDAVRFLAEPGGTYPTGITVGTTYYAVVVDARSFTLLDAPSGSGGVPVVLSGSYTGYHRAYKGIELPRDWATAPSCPSANVSLSAGNGRWTVSDNSFQAGDKVRLTTTLGNLPTDVNGVQLQTGTTYYIESVDSASPSTWLRLSYTQGGAAIDFDSSGSGSGGSGTHTVHRYYEQGDLMFWDGTLTLTTPGVYYCSADHQQDPSDPGTDTANWFLQTADALLSVPAPYAVADVMDVKFAQSNDVMTLTHPGYPAYELRRLGALKWDLRVVAFEPPLAAPTGLSASSSRGERFTIYREDDGTQVGATAFISKYWAGDATYAPNFINTTPDIAVGDVVYMEYVSGTFANFASDGSNDGYYVANASFTASGSRVLNLRDPNTGLVLTHSPSQNNTGVLYLYVASQSAEREQEYVVTSVDDNRVESIASDPITVANILDVPGASNALSWTAVSGAVRYRVYKKQNGIYGFVGESEDATFTDDSIGPDLGDTPPIIDDSLSGTDYPRSVGYYQQRRVFAGTTLNPRKVLMTRSSTESGLTYSIPVKDDDRISFDLAARQAATVRHVVPMSELLLLAQSGEYRVGATDGGVITPSARDARQQTEIGCSDVRPQVVNANVVFCANRGGHVRELGYNWQAQGYVGGDLSMRAAHLFDDYSLLDSAYGKSPWPCLWFPSSSEKLLAMTYVPEEQIGGWHQHDTDGVIESVCVIPEGQFDTLYAVIQRTVNGATVRNIERMVPVSQDDTVTGVYSDASWVYSGVHNLGCAVKVSSAGGFTAGDTVTVALACGPTYTVPYNFFARTGEVGEEFELRSAGLKIRVRVTAYDTNSQATCELLSDLPEFMRNVWLTDWSYCWKTIPVTPYLEHLIGKTVQIVRDGVVESTQVVPGAGEILTLEGAGEKIRIGLAYTSEMQTLPVAVQMEAFARGRAKNINKAWLRVEDTAAGLQVGPSADDLVPVQQLDSAALTSGEVQTTLPPEWTQDGAVVLRQSEPLPATIIGLALEVSLGG